MLSVLQATESWAGWEQGYDGGTLSQYKCMQCTRTYVAVLGRNEEHYLHILIALPRSKRSSTNFCKDGAHTCCVNVVSIHEFTQRIYMSLAFNGSSALECFERGKAIEICNGIMFDFYLRVPHIQSVTNNICSGDLRLDSSFSFAVSVYM